MSFNGVNPEITIDEIANKSHPFTLEMWIKDLNTFVGPLFGIGNSGSMFAIDVSHNTLRMVYWGGDTNFYYGDTSGWHHFCIQNNWSTHYIHIDGTLVFSRNSGAGGWSNLMLFHRNGYGHNGACDAIIDELLLTKDMKYGPSNFTPQTIPYDPNYSILDCKDNFYGLK